MKISKEAEARLQELAVAGQLTPENVMKEGTQDKKSPFYEHFTHGLKEAATKCWLDEARALIRSVKYEVTVENKGVIVPKYVHDPQAPTTANGTRGQGYIETMTAKNDLETARAILRSEISRAIGAMERANRIASVFGLTDEIDGMISTLTSLHEKVENADGVEATQ